MTEGINKLYRNDWMESPQGIYSYIQQHQHLPAYGATVPVHPHATTWLQETIPTLPPVGHGIVDLVASVQMVMYRSTTVALSQNKSVLVSMMDDFIR